MLQILIDFRARVSTYHDAIDEEMEDPEEDDCFYTQLNPWYKVWKLEFPMIKFLN